MQKYNVVKPIWSTELGLNSQGMARNVVAAELIKKFAVFFASGGANASWFDFLYPDNEGTGGDSAGAAHDVFDSRFSLYAPKLTAIAYYNAVNAIAIKKFVTEKQYPNGIRAFLFRDHDGHALANLVEGQRPRRCWGAPARGASRGHDRLRRQPPCPECGRQGSDPVHQR